MIGSNEVRMTYDFVDVTKGITFKRYTGSPRMRRESTLWYHVKNLLKDAGYDAVRQVPAKDGHLFSAPYYIRERRGKWYLFDAEYAIRDMAKAFNEGETITLYYGGK